MPSPYFVEVVTVPSRESISAVAPNRDATKQRASPKPKKRRAKSGKRGWSKSIRIRNEMTIVDGRQRMSVIRFQEPATAPGSIAWLDRTRSSIPRTAGRSATTCCLISTGLGAGATHLEMLDIASCIPIEWSLYVPSSHHRNANWQTPTKQTKRANPF